MGIKYAIENIYAMNYYEDGVEMTGSSNTWNAVKIACALKHVHNIKKKAFSQTSQCPARQIR